MTKTIILEDMVIINGLSKERIKFLEKCKKIIKESTSIIVGRNPNFNSKLLESNPYKLIIRPSLRIAYDAAVETGGGCYIESVNISPKASVMLMNKECLGIDYKGYRFHINYKKA